MKPKHLNRKPNRLQDFDYSFPASYFITICTKDKYSYFGQIKNDKVELNRLGKIAHENWKNISDFYPEILVDEFIVMPNHIHGILGIVYEFDYVSDKRAGNDAGLPRRPVGAISNRPYKAKKKKYGLLSRVIKEYKSITTKQIRKSHNSKFSWQKSYYDHIIRKHEDLDKIREYIFNNALHWDKDRYYLEV